MLWTLGHTDILPEIITVQDKIKHFTVNEEKKLSSWIAETSNHMLARLFARNNSEDSLNLYSVR